MYQRGSLIAHSSCTVPSERWVLQGAPAEWAVPALLGERAAPPPFWNLPAHASAALASHNLPGKGMLLESGCSSQHTDKQNRVGGDFPVLDFPTKCKKKN